MNNLIGPSKFVLHALEERYGLDDGKMMSILLACLSYVYRRNGNSISQFKEELTLFCEELEKDWEE